MANSAPVITIDGPSGSGKGTIARLLAKELGWHVLDSGALYRAFAWAVKENSIDWENRETLQKLVEETKLELIECGSGEKLTVKCNGQDITDAIRSEDCGLMASKISVLPLIRDAVMPYQREMRRLPGLVADGRDMGTVVFPDSKNKFYLTASAAERARRRQLQLMSQGNQVDIFQLQVEINERDTRDRERDIAPAKPAKDAIIVGTTDLSIHEVFTSILNYLSL